MRPGRDNENARPRRISDQIDGVEAFRCNRGKRRPKNAILLLNDILGHAARTNAVLLEAALQANVEQQGNHRHTLRATNAQQRAPVRTLNRC